MSASTEVLLPLETIEHVTRALLVRLLSDDAAFCAAHGVSLDALAATE